MTTFHSNPRAASIRVTLLRCATLRHATQRIANLDERKPIMQASICTVTITGIAPLSQSRQHEEPKLEGESHDDYDRRTWRSKLNVEERDGKMTVVIPAHGMQQAIAAAARYSGKKIVGQGAKTWSKKITAGIAIFENPALNIDPAGVDFVAIPCGVNGQRGEGKRVIRRFPQIPNGWSATFEVYILDPIITEEVFVEMTELAGMFIGIGRFRPQNGGTIGRFKLTDHKWQDNRQFVA